MKKYTKAVISSRFFLIFSALFVIPFCLLCLTALVLQLFVYRPFDKDEAAANAAMVVPLTTLSIVCVVLFRRFFSALGKIGAELGEDLKEYVEYCEKSVSGKFFFFENCFISFDDPAMFRYEQVKEIYYWYRRGRRANFYFVSVKLKGDRSYKMNCSGERSQRKLVEELKVCAPDAKLKNDYRHWKRGKYDEYL